MSVLDWRSADFGATAVETMFALGIPHMGLNA